MSYPKRRKKLITDLNPPKVGNEYLKYGMDRIEELMAKTDAKTKYLPRTIQLEDLDRVVFNYANEEGMKAVIDGKIVPVFYLDNDRWGEFSKTWKFMDDDKNVPTPYITVRRIDKQPGTRLGGKARVPQPRAFRYYTVPIMDEGEVINLLFKIPEPVNVDLVYEVTLFTKYRVDVNDYDEQVLRNFASMQEYVWVKGTPFPLKFEGFAESNPIENIDGDRFFVSKYALRVLGYIQDEKEFQITKATRQPRFEMVVDTHNSYKPNITATESFKTWYVRPSTGGTYGTEDGSSYENAWNGFDSIVWDDTSGTSGITRGDTLYVTGTHNETLTVSASGADGYPINIRGDYSLEAGIINMQSAVSVGVNVSSKNYITFHSLSIANATISCLNIEGTSSNIITNYITVSGSGNQGVQHLNSASAVHNNITAVGNTDDGISAHDDAMVYVNGGTIIDNAQGVNNVNNSIIYVSGGVYFSGNTQYDVWAANGGTIEVSGSTFPTMAYVNGLATLKLTDCYAEKFWCSSGNVEALRCLFASNVDGEHMVDLENGDSGSFKYCIFKPTGATRFALVSRDGSNLVADNLTIVGNNDIGRGIFCANLTNGVVMNNIIFYNLETAILQTLGTAISNNSLFYSNLTNVSGTVVENDDLDANPLFNDPDNNDFSFAIGSPCDGNGITLSNIEEGLETANWGAVPPTITTKAQGSSWDIGAYIN